jgi:hypothetical protein
MRALILILHWGLAAVLFASGPAYPRDVPGRHVESQSASKGSKAPHRAERSRKPGGAGSFASEIKDLIRAKSGELCASYGQANNCVDEVEVCVTMIDEDDAEVRLCLNDNPGDRDPDKTRRTAARR